MKVLILANHLNFGGITAYILNLCRVLQGKNGIEIYVGSRGGELENEFTRLGVKLIKLPLTTKCEVSPKVFISFLKLLKIIKEHNITVIHANTRVTQVLAALLSFFTGRPYISTCHGYFKVRLFRRLLPCWGVKIIAISSQVKRHLVDDFHISSERIELIHNGIPLDKARIFTKEEIEAEKKVLGLDDSKKIVGHVGRLSSVKGQKFFIFAADKLVKQRKDVQFLIIGDGGEEGELRKLICSLKLEKFVLIYPSVKDTVLALAVMDVFVMPSLQEGLGISILEAQANGVPVVASSVGGILDIIKDEVTGLLFKVGDVEALALGISRLLDDIKLRNVIVENALVQLKDKFSLNLMIEKTRALYEEVQC